MSLYDTIIDMGSKHVDVYVEVCSQATQAYVDMYSHVDST